MNEQHNPNNKYNKMNEISKSESVKVSSFKVGTYSLLDKDTKYPHWSEGLNMVITKDGVTIKLNSQEIQQMVKSLPRTIGGSY